MDEGKKLKAEPAPRLGGSNCRDLASGKVREETVRLRPELDILGLGKQTRPRVALRSETRKESTRLLCGGGNTHTHKGV